jgi:aspartyl-tRNA(Asn)/glutamyl-tRNA(Gln) amidotransferase subunit C
MALTEKDVDYVARLARLQVTPEERALYTSQLAKILDHAAELNSVDVSQVAPTSHVLPLKNVLRKDEPGQPMSREDVLLNAPDKSKGCFRVPKIID